MLTLALALLAAPLQAAEPPTPPAAAPGLRIEGGYAEATPVTPGARIHVWAQQDPRTQVFLGWEGAAAEHLDARDAWHAVLTVPADGLAEPTLRARMVAVAAEAQSLTFAGPAREKVVDYVLPAASPARALVFFCHDVGARRGALRKTEAWNVALTFVHHGYAVAAINSEEADTQKAGEDGQLRWNGKDDALETNLDLQNLLAARAALIAAGAVAPDADCFTFGQGNGGTFAASAAAVLEWRAAASFCGPGRKQLLEKQAAPTIWIVTTQNYVIRNAADVARECRQLLEARGVPAKVHLVGPSPLRAERLADRLGMDADVAAGIVATMHRTGVLDPAGMLVVPGITAATRVEAETLAYEDFHIWNAEDPARMAEFTQQIEIVGAGHVLLADHALRVLAFFEAQRAD